MRKIYKICLLKHLVLFLSNDSFPLICLFQYMCAHVSPQNLKDGRKHPKQEGTLCNIYTVINKVSFTIKVGESLEMAKTLKKYWCTLPMYFKRNQQ